jgi:hypothetical protein
MRLFTFSIVYLFSLFAAYLVHALLEHRPLGRS